MRSGLCREGEYEHGWKRTGSVGRWYMNIRGRREGALHGKHDEAMQRQVVVPSTTSSGRAHSWQWKGWLSLVFVVVGVGKKEELCEVEPVHSRCSGREQDHGTREIVCSGEASGKAVAAVDAIVNQGRKDVVVDLVFDVAVVTALSPNWEQKATKYYNMESR